MDDQLTVAELIAILQRMPQDMLVEIGMNQEYQQGLYAGDVRIESYFEQSRGSYVHIGD